jgi:hypothetical protein
MVPGRVKKAIKSVAPVDENSTTCRVQANVVFGSVAVRQVAIISMTASECKAACQAWFFRIENLSVYLHQYRSFRLQEPNDFDRQETARSGH